MKIRIFFLSLSFILASLSAFSNNYHLKENISYTSLSNDYAQERCKLDVYYSPDFKDKPVVIWFHGGGLVGGEKFIPEELQKDSLVVVGVNYRLLPKAEINEIIDDAAAAVAWTMQNIKDYGGDPEKIFLAGHSAGGYLISMIGLDKKWLNKYGIDADTLKGLFPYSGQVLTHYELRNLQGISPLQPTIDEFAPLSHIRKDAPPYIIISGDREEELYGRYEENAYMWRMMKLNGHPYVYLYELDGYNHGDMAKPAHHILKTHIKQILSDSKK